MKSKIILFIFSTCISLFIGEIIVRILNPQINFNSAVRYSFHCAAKDSRIPFTLADNKTCIMENYYTHEETKVHINSLGYRGKEFNLDKKTDSKRVLILGDSFTFGLNVNDDEVYPAILENIMKENGKRNVEVINAGYADGYSPDSYYLYLKERGLRLNPDLVVIGFFVWNDIEDLSDTVWTQIDRDGFPQNIISCCREVDDGIWRRKDLSLKYRIPILRESHLFIQIFSLLEKWKFFSSGIISQSSGEKYKGCSLVSYCIYRFYHEEKKMQDMISAIKKLADEAHIPLAIMVIPTDYQLYPSAFNAYVDTIPLKSGEVTFIQKRLGTFFSSLNIPYLDLYPAMDDSRVRELGYPYIQKDAHFNPLGHRIVAKELYEFIEKNKLL